MTYPGALDSFTTKVDGVDSYLAAHMNAVQTSVVNIETELGTDPAGSMTDIKSRLVVSLAADGDLALAGVSNLTITSGEITVTGNRHTVDTEASAASDDLDTINGGSAGFVVFLRSYAAARDVVIKHNTGNILCPGGSDITLADLNEYVIGIYDSGQSKWMVGKMQSGELDGTGTAGTLPVWSDANTLGDSIIKQDTGTGIITFGAGAADTDYILRVDGEDNDGDIQWQEDEQLWKIWSYIQGATSMWRRYYQFPMFGSNPGASGATWAAPGANHTGGWQLDAASEYLYFQSAVFADWDEASDLRVKIRFLVNADNSGGGSGDTVDLKLVCYYNGVGETATKTQTVEVATVIGQSAQYNVFEAEFVIDFDYADNVVEEDDQISFILNLETDTSEVDDIIILAGWFSYESDHLGIWSTDV